MLRIRKSVIPPVFLQEEQSREEEPIQKEHSCKDAFFARRFVRAGSGGGRGERAAPACGAALCGGSRSLHRLRTGKPSKSQSGKFGFRLNELAASQHDADREPDEGGDSACVELEIARQAAIAADPGQSSFDDPALGQDDELVRCA